MRIHNTTKILQLFIVIFSCWLMTVSSIYAISNSTAEPESEIEQILDKMSPDQQSTLDKRMLTEREAFNNPLSVILYRPNYVLPFYYTSSPDTVIYNNNTPNNQPVMKTEFKSQLSFLVPIIPQLFHNPGASLDIAYTQLNYWQIYAASRYFRETNYEPEVFFEDYFHPNWLWRIGINHQSNGRGGILERSWNRAITTLQFSSNNWLVGLNLWALVFKANNSDLDNPDIAYYLGHENLLFAYSFPHCSVALLVQNIESGFQRGNQQITLAIPITRRIALYTQFFNGYGQSLIEYNHRTQAAGIGIAFNDFTAPTADSLIFNGIM